MSLVMELRLSLTVPSASSTGSMNGLYKLDVGLVDQLCEMTCYELGA